MSGREKFYWLMGGVLTLLVIATVAGAWLRARAASDATRAVVENLNSRIRGNSSPLPRPSRRTTYRSS